MSPWSTKAISFACATLNCLVAGSVVCFALYAPQLQTHLHYTQLQVNSIGIACQLGLYLTVPFLGWICDSLGPRVLCILPAILSLPVYSLAALAYSKSYPLWVLVSCFALLGPCTAALYLSGLSTVAKNHPTTRGLAMAIITASFGLSGLWETQLADKLFRNLQNEIDIPRLFIFFGLLLSGTAIIGVCGLQIVPHTLQEEEDEETPLLESADDSTTGQRMKDFIQDHSSWWYFLAFILLAGPGEVFTNNLGTMFHSLKGVNTMSSSSTQVSLFLLSSTLGRLFFGALCDLPAKSPITSRMTVLIVTAASLSFGFLFLSLPGMNADLFLISSISIGAGYGGLFTVYPAIISIVWGTENFATFWGCLAVAPAIGSTTFGIMYAKIYDRKALEQIGAPGKQCLGQDCFRMSTRWMAIANILGIFIIVGALFVWRRRFS